MGNSSIARVAVTLAVGVGFSVLANQPRALAAPAALSIDPNSETVVYRAKSAPCAMSYKPDSPLRAFVRSDGRVVAIAGHIVNYEMTGPSVENLHVDCNPVLRSEEAEDPTKLSDRSWIAATWTDDGRKVRALIHDEYQAHRFPNRCKFKSYMMCWYNTITAYHSDDGGRSFFKSDPLFAIGSYLRFNGAAGRHIGFYNPSNIIRKNNFLYTFAFTNGFAGQKPGVCLFRSPIGRSGTWYGWDGSAFSVKMQNPYSPAAKAEKCKTLPYLGSVVGSVVRHSRTNMYLAVTSSTGRDGKTVFSYSQSRDFTSWSPTRKLLDLPTMWSKNCADVYRYGYPSMISAKPYDRNFSSTSDDGYLFLTRFHVHKCNLSEDRDLVRYNYQIR